MACFMCGGQTHDDNPWGPWCDACGGIAAGPGRLLFRHVATVEGPGGRFPIVWDVSTSDYAYMLKTPHPPDPKRDKQRDMDGFKRPRVQVAHGTLDAVIAISYPDVKGEADEGVYLYPAPTSTEEERAIMLDPGPFR